MVGIYGIKNKINEKIYIGRSTDIERRWKTHLRDARKGDMCKIHIAMRELGIENFYLIIIEECPVEELNEKEQFYIDFYDSWHNGYNNGNSSNFLDGEKNHNAKMSEEDIKNIRYEQSLLLKNRREIYEKYKNKITWTNFLFICKYKTWPGVLPELNTQKIMNWHKKQLGNENKKFSIDQLEDIIKLKYQDGLSYKEISEIYNKNVVTIRRIFENVYYKKEMKFLKETKPELFPN